MKKIIAFLLLPLFILNMSVAALAPLDAEAARFGGGRSFGGRPLFNRSVPAPTRQPAAPTQQNRTANTSIPARGGVLGPLLAGTAIGALLFGGAFSGLGGMDFLLIALVGFLAFRLFSVRRRTVEQEAGGGGHDGAFSSRPTAGNGRRHSQWDVLRGNTSAQSAAAYNSGGLNLPREFDAQDFMKGAKLVFSRMQSSWDKRDMADIAAFTTPAMLQLVREQAAADPGPSKTDVLIVDGSLCDFEEEGTLQRAAVYFTAMLRENPAEAPHEIQELWHFTRDTAYGETWRLDGIQQVQ